MSRDKEYIKSHLDQLSDDEQALLIELIDSKDSLPSKDQKDRIKKNVLSSISTKGPDTAERPRAKHKRSRIRLALAAVALIIILATSFSPAGRYILAEIKERLYFIPGTGEVVRDNQSGVYLLDKPIELTDKSGKLIIKSIIKQGESLLIEMAGDGDMPPKLVLQARDGSEYKSTNSWYASGDGWIGGSHYITPADMLDYRIILSGNIFAPVKLTRAQGVEDYEQLGPTEYKNGLGLTLVASRENGRVRLNPIEHPQAGRRVILYGYIDSEGGYNDNVIIKDSNGTSYPLTENKGPSRGANLSFEPNPDISEYHVKIPELLVQYDIREEVKIPIPEDGATVDLNKTLNINGFTLQILRAKRHGNRLKLFVDTDYDSKRAENINTLQLRLPYDSYSYSDHYNDNLVIDHFDLEIRPGDKKLTITFDGLINSLKGPWAFDITSK